MSKLLILIVIILGAIAIALLMRTYELGKKLSNRKEEEISEKDNNLASKLFILFMIAFFGSFIYLMAEYGRCLPPAATEHGKAIDWLLDINFIIVIVVFFLTNTLLFVFARIYRRKKGVKAYYYPHNNKLEMIWTVVPAVVLAFIIIFGLKTWNDITSASPKEAIHIELFSEQFKWTARYSGDDNVLGGHDYKLTTDKNQLGLVTTATLDSAIRLMEYGTDDGSVLGIKLMEEKLNDKNLMMIPKDREKLETDLDRKTRLLRLLYQMRGRHDASKDKFAYDDVIETDTLHLIVNKNYEMTFRAKDVIHSAYFPHFRVQMNTVPGLTTRFKFKPVYTTAEMRKIKKDDAFNYVLMCNKICGSAHYKMKMMVVVQTQEEFDTWMKTKTTFGSTFLAQEKGTDTSSDPLTSGKPIEVADTIVLINK